MLSTPSSARAAPSTASAAKHSTQAFAHTGVYHQKTRLAWSPNSRVQFPAAGYPTLSAFTTPLSLHFLLCCLFVYFPKPSSHSRVKFVQKKILLLLRARRRGMKPCPWDTFYQFSIKTLLSNTWSERIFPKQFFVYQCATIFVVSPVQCPGSQKGMWS